MSRYAECTGSVINALVLFKLHPGYRKQEIENVIRKAVQYFEDMQMPDGSWYFSIQLLCLLKKFHNVFFLITSIVEQEIYMKEHLHRFGTWGICFTYATWFELRGLAAAGKTYHNCLAICKAANFLLKLHLDDGGWGESYLSCLAKVKQNFHDFSFCASSVCYRLKTLMIYGEI